MNTTILPPLAFDIGSPWMLLWAAAAVAPLLIHLLSRRKHREMSWAAMEYLLAAIEKQSRRMRLEQLILLAVRTLLVLLFVLALAELLTDQIDLVTRSDQRVHRLFVLDGSYSMGRRAAGKTRWEVAKEIIARTLTDQSQRGDAYTLVLMATPPRVIVRTPSLDRGFFLEEIEQLEMPHGGGDLLATLQLVQETLAVARSEFPHIGQHQIHFLTDLGRTSWAPDDTSSQWQARLSELARSLSKAAQLFVEDVSLPGSANLAVTHIGLEQSLVVAGRDVMIEATIRSFSDQPIGPTPAAFYVDGRLIAKRPLSIDRPRGEAVVAAEYRFAAAGDRRVEVRLDSGIDLGTDSLAIDNRRWLCVPVKEKINVLCVAGKPGACDYLPLALRPDDSRQAIVEVRVVSQGVLWSDVDWNAYDCLFLSNIGQFTSGQAQRLRSYLRGGGSLVFFLGDQAVAESYNQTLGGDRPGGAALLPARLIGPMAMGKYQLDPGDYRHPIVRPFEGRRQAGLLSTPLRRYLRLSVDPSSGARVALRAVVASGSPVSVTTAGQPLGDPILVEWACERGRVILFAMPGSVASVDPATRAPWTYWPLWGSFLPIINESLKLALSDRLAQRNVLVGQVISGTLPLSSGAPALSVTSPGPHPKTESVRTIPDADLRRWSFDQTGRSGIYRVGDSGKRPTGAEQSADSKLFAVNLDTSESDLAKIDVAELPESFTRTADRSESPVVGVAQVVRHAGLFAYLLYGVLALLLIESALAWWFGARTS